MDYSTHSGGSESNFIPKFCSLTDRTFRSMALLLLRYPRMQMLVGLNLLLYSMCKVI